MVPRPTPARPRDAASLVLVRSPRRGGAREVLLGRRGRSDAFMPGWFVFPGGGVEPGDARHPSLSELRPATEREIARHARPGVARALAVAALRETREETGVALGASDPVCGFRPDLATLTYFARAITPTMSPMRFHARFFLAEIDADATPAGPLRGDGELRDLGWFTLERALELEIVDVTRFVLDEAARLLAGIRRGTPLYCYRGTAGRARYL